MIGDRERFGLHSPGKCIFPPFLSLELISASSPSLLKGNRTLTRCSSVKAKDSDSSKLLRRWIECLRCHFSNRRRRMLDVANSKLARPGDRCVSTGNISPLERWRFAEWPRLDGVELLRTREKERGRLSSVDRIEWFLWFKKKDEEKMRVKFKRSHLRLIIGHAHLN